MMVHKHTTFNYYSLTLEVWFSNLRLFLMVQCFGAKYKNPVCKDIKLHTGPQLPTFEMVQGRPSCWHLQTRWLKKPTLLSVWHNLWGYWWAQQIAYFVPPFLSLRNQRDDKHNIIENDSENLKLKAVKSSHWWTGCARRLHPWLWKWTAMRRPRSCCRRTRSSTSSWLSHCPRLVSTRQVRNS